MSKKTDPVKKPAPVPTSSPVTPETAEPAIKLPPLYRPIDWLTALVATVLSGLVPLHLGVHQDPSVLERGLARGGGVGFRGSDRERVAQPDGVAWQQHDD